MSIPLFNGLHVATNVKGATLVPQVKCRLFQDGSWQLAHVGGGGVVIHPNF